MSKRQPRFDIHVVPRRYPVSEVSRSFDMPATGKNRQECVGSVARPDKGVGPSPFRNWSQDNSGATVLNIDSIVQAAASSRRSIGRDVTGYDRVTFLSARFRNCSAHRPALFRKRATRAFPDSAASFFSPRFDSIRTFHIRAVLLLQPIPNFNFSELELLFFFFSRRRIKRE